jgi:hypothetical protein
MFQIRSESVLFSYSQFHNVFFPIFSEPNLKTFNFFKPLRNLFFHQVFIFFLLETNSLSIFNSFFVFAKNLLISSKQQTIQFLWYSFHGITISNKWRLFYWMRFFKILQTNVPLNDRCWLKFQNGLHNLLNLQKFHIVLFGVLSIFNFQ